MINLAELKRPLIFIDVESTGTDPVKDRIVSLSVVAHKDRFDSLGGYWDSGTSGFKSIELRFDPQVEMSDEVIAIHGITNEEAKRHPTFKSQADIVIPLVTGCDIAGFNLLGLDIPIIHEELNRCGFEWDLEGVRFIDAGNIFKKKEPRDLTAAVKFYCRRKLEGAHNAGVDAAATLDVLLGQLNYYSDLRAMDIDQLAQFCKMDDRVDLAGIIVRNKDGVPCFNTKRNRGVPVNQDFGYAEWMLRSDFPTNTKRVISRILEEASEPVEVDDPRQEKLEF